ncbi:MAG: galactonate dehydratase [Planctomycetota bacterium]
MSLQTKPDKIACYELFRVTPRWLFLRIETDQGVVGWGEPVVEGYAEAVEATVRVMMESLIGKDAGRIQYHWQTLAKGDFYGGLGPVMMSALAGIDQALWDIKGKTLGASVVDLLGGSVRDRQMVYGHVAADFEPDDIAAAVAKKRCDDYGFKLIKLCGSPPMGYTDQQRAIEAGAARVAAVRAAVGPDIQVAVDFHGRCKLPMARKLMRALEPYDIAFFEEVVHPDFNDALPDLANWTEVPLATGERMFHYADFYDLLRRPGVSIIQPDPSHAGGITHCLDIARLAEHRDVALALHCPLGPIALAACLAIDFVCLNAEFQESGIGLTYKPEDGGRGVLDYVLNPEDFKLDADGAMPPLPGPGLGVQMNEELIREMAKTPHEWRGPIEPLPDGSPTRW